MVRLRDSWPFSLSSAPTVGNPCRPLQPESVLRLMIVPWHAEGLRHLLELHGRLQHHALRELVHHLALDLLPGRLARWIGVAAPRAEIGAAAFQLLVRDQDVGRAPVE